MAPSPSGRSFALSESEDRLLRAVAFLEGMHPSLLARVAVLDYLNARADRLEVRKLVALSKARAQGLHVVLDPPGPTRTPT